MSEDNQAPEEDEIVGTSAELIVSDDVDDIVDEVSVEDKPSPEQTIEDINEANAAELSQRHLERNRLAKPRRDKTLTGHKREQY